MALRFNGKKLYGTHGPILFGAPEPQLRRVHFWGVKGEGEIVGQNGGRSLTVDIILHNQYATYDKLRKALDEISRLISTNGTLEETGNCPQKFEDVTFERWEPIPFPSQANAGPIMDVGGCLTAENGEADGGWIRYVLLTFRQLRVDKKELP